MQAGRMSVDELAAFLDAEFPQINAAGRSYVVEAAGHGYARMRLLYHDRHLRPGGTISGPAMFALSLIHI